MLVSVTVTGTPFSATESPFFSWRILSGASRAPVL
jgi:hypothetical protein